MTSDRGALMSDSRILASHAEVREQIMNALMPRVIRAFVSYSWTAPAGCYNAISSAARYMAMIFSGGTSARILWMLQKTKPPSCHR